MAATLRSTAAQLLVAAVLCVVLLVAPTISVAAPAAPASGADAASSKYAAPLLPAFEQFFAQQFRVSVMTQSYGVFNATLRMRGSLNFPERVQGELIPLGEPRLNRQKQSPLPHFARVRGVEDDKLSELPFASSSAPGKSEAGKTGSSEFTAAGEEERPSLLVLDLQLLHSDATEGKAQVYYLPAELMALRSQREGMSEGTASPAATVDFTFRLEAPPMSNNPLSDVPALARMTAAALVGKSRKSEDAAEDEAAAAAAEKGEMVFRWLTEHEFSAVFSVPIPSDVAGAPPRMERVSVYGYAAPSKSVFDRKQREVPWYNKYMMLGIALLGFVVQIISGWTEGKTKAINDAEKEQRIKAREQAKLEAELKQQDRQNKKKK